MHARIGINTEQLLSLSFEKADHPLMITDILHMLKNGRTKLMNSNITLKVRVPVFINHTAIKSINSRCTKGCLEYKLSCQNV